MKAGSPHIESGDSAQVSDQEILAMMADGPSREKGFNLLIDKYKEKIYWHVRRMLISHDDTDDVVQDIFIKIWNNIHKFRGDSALFTWIYRIASNEALGYLGKKRKSYLLTLSNVSDKLANSLESDAFFTGDDMQLKFQQALLTLPDKQRLVFNMKYFEELKYEEISAVTGVTVGGLKASYHHAVKKIEKYISHG